MFTSRRELHVDGACEDSASIVYAALVYQRTRSDFPESGPVDVHKSARSTMSTLERRDFCFFHRYVLPRGTPSHPEEWRALKAVEKNSFPRSIRLVSTIELRPLIRACFANYLARPGETLSKRTLFPRFPHDFHPFRPLAYPIARGAVEISC